uniref:Putative alpha-tubulin suppressor n=1 Tax=Ixodes ricinus TaxID=34613 RepID=A0A0K8RLT7_IXORI
MLLDEGRRRVRHGATNELTERPRDLGDPNCTEQETPRKVPGLPPCVDISCGDSVSFAVTAEGRVFSWGFGENLQLGHGDDSEDVLEPKVMTGKLISSKKALLVSGRWPACSHTGHGTPRAALDQSSSVLCFTCLTLIIKISKSKKNTKTRVNTN